MTATTFVAVPRMGKAQLIAACTIGNALEFYDFVIFSFFAGTIGALFFPAENATVQLMLALATYGVGFVLRPLGGVVLGAYADRKGRKKATILTLFLMAFGTALIGLLPTYAQIGPIAPLLIVLARLIQGFSAGGEVGASTTLLAEYAPKEERGFYGSWQLASQGLAILVAAALAWAINNFMPATELKAWGWRIPFFLGIFIVPIGLWLRSALRETHANEDDATTREVSSLSLTFKEHFSKVILGVMMIIGGTASNAIVVLYMSTYAVHQLHMPPATALFAGLAAGLVTLVVAPIAGALSDRVGRKPVAWVAYVLMALTIYPAFLLLNAYPALPTLLMVVFFLGSLNAAGGATIIITLAEIFPAEVRATGMSLVYALGVAIFGGFGQFIVTWMIKVSGDPIAPAWYVVVCCTATVVALFGIKEMSQRELD